MATTLNQDTLKMLIDTMPRSEDNGAGQATRVGLTAHRLAVVFMDDAELPARLRKSVNSKHAQKNKKDSELEKRYRANVESWQQLIEMMLTKISGQQAWRFVELAPRVEPGVRKATECQDFCDFLDYLILRRDTEECGGEELGLLAMLFTAFQRQIESTIST